MSGGKFVNVLAMKYTPGSGPVYEGSWSEPTTGEAVAKVYEGWEPRVLGLMRVRLLERWLPDHANSPAQAVKEPFCWAMHTAPELSTYVSGRAALVGDAVRISSPPSSQASPGDHP